MSEWQWIIEDDLESVFAKLNRIYDQDPNQVEGECMAFAVQRLLVSEYKVGGPYKSRSGMVDPKTNSLIDLFLRKCGTELPNLRPYRSQEVTERSSTKKQADYKGYEKMKLTVNTELLALPVDVRPSAKRMWRSICNVDKNHREIGLISTFFADSLVVQGKPSREKLHDLGVSNFYTWMAYTIYDDFFDDEGEPGQLPFANIAMRRALLGYISVWKNKNLHLLVQETFTRMDEANAWELAQARATLDGSYLTIKMLPKYGKNYVLSNRAFGHALGPLMIASQIESLSSNQYKKILDGLRHFLIARQLNDDLHDWQKDWRAGHLSPVVTYLLKNCGVKSGRSNVNKTALKLEKFFWSNGLIDLSKITLNHISACKRAFLESELVVMDGDFASIIQRLENAMIATQRIHSDNQTFLTAYKNLRIE